MPAPRGATTRFRLLALATAAALAAAACASDGGQTTTPEATGTATAPGVTGEIVVFAAASLTDVFEELADGFEEANPEATVTFNFASSSGLATQINQTGGADVFAAANENTMRTVVDAGNVEGEPTIFVTNTLVIVVEDGNPQGIEGLRDLADNPDLIVVLCAEEVPCGAAARTAIDGAGLSITPDSFAENVRAALTAVSTGEADAALVYRTDATVERAVDAVEFPQSPSSVNRYPIAVLREAENPEGARAWVDYVLSAEGRALLDRYGFGEP